MRIYTVCLQLPILDNGQTWMVDKQEEMAGWILKCLDTGQWYVLQICHLCWGLHYIQGKPWCPPFFLYSRCLCVNILFTPIMMPPATGWIKIHKGRKLVLHIYFDYQKKEKQLFRCRPIGHSRINAREVPVWSGLVYLLLRWLRWRFLGTERGKEELENILQRLGSGAKCLLPIGTKSGLIWETFLIT